MNIIEKFKEICIKQPDAPIIICPDCSMRIKRKLILKHINSSKCAWVKAQKDIFKKSLF